MGDPEQERRRQQSQSARGLTMKLIGGPDSPVVALDPRTAAAFHCECGSEFFIPVYRVAFDRFNHKANGLVPASEHAVCANADCRRPVVTGPDLAERIALAADEQKAIDAERRDEENRRKASGDGKGEDLTTG